MTSPIERFDGTEYRFLSNFYTAKTTIYGHTFLTSEHAYQFAKTLDGDAMRRIRDAPTPADAKRLGRAAPLRPDWDVVKLGVMYDVLRAKFSQNEDLAKALVATGDAYLQEGNHWADRTWGRTANEDGKWEGDNYLGILLMLIRAQLRQGAI